ncbi:MAG: hypothetical protein GF364_16640 [Candidatus Lokiarchaeota archaeon]|nr:hypothetical protein [Candidatus Lokiarchaeota archaeon]
MVIDKDDEYSDYYLSMEDSYFDIFEHLYDDYDTKFSKLKIMVWNARGKGPTDFLKYLYEKIIESNGFGEIKSEYDFSDLYIPDPIMRTFILIYLLIDLY